MKISIVVAISENNAIGKAGDLLWRLPKDMQRFKEITIGHHVLMGRKTFESIPEKFRPLEGRTNIIVSRKKDFAAEGCKVVSDIDEGIDFAKQNGENELMVIGGGEIYKLIFPRTNKIYLTRVHQIYLDADTFSPQMEEVEWKIISEEKFPADEKHQFAYDFLTLERK